MSTNGAIQDVIDLVGRRIEMLDCLLEGGTDKRTIVNQLDASRSTIDRGIRELEAVEFIDWEDGTYAPNLCGKLMADEYRRFEERIQRFLELQPLLRWIPVDDFDLEVDWLADAELFVPEQGDPYAMINQHVDRLKRAESGRFILPYVGQHAAEAAYESTIHHGATYELVVEPSVMKTFQTDPFYSELVEPLLETGRVDVWVYEGSFPYAVGIIDEAFVQLAADEHGQPRALLESDADEVRRWAEHRIETYKDRARKVTDKIVPP